MIWHIAIHISIRSNQNITSDFDCSNNRGIYANPNAVTNYRRTLALSTVFLPDRNTFMQVYVLA